jgi:hypothetical protein
MIKTEEELFISDQGGDPTQEIELSHGASIKLTQLLRNYRAQHLPPAVEDQKHIAETIQALSSAILANKAAGTYTKLQGNCISKMQYLVDKIK